MLPLELVDELCGGRKHSVGLSATDVALGALLVVAQRTPFAKIMFAARDDGTLERAAADETSKRNAVVVVIIVRAVAVTAAAFFAHESLATLLALLLLPFALEHPPALVVRSVVQVDTAVAV